MIVEARDAQVRLHIGDIVVLPDGRDGAVYRFLLGSNEVEVFCDGPRLEIWAVENLRRGRL